MISFQYLIKEKKIRRFSKNTKKLREAKDISQGDIHRATGIDRAYISNLEDRKQNLIIETIDKIAEALGTTGDKLLK